MAQAILILLAVIVVAVIWERETSGTREVAERSYNEAAAAADADDWATAFRRFRELAETDPTFRDVTRQVRLAAEQLIDGVKAGLPIDIEVELLRWLATEGDQAILAATIDQSMVDVPGGWSTMGSNQGSASEQPTRSVYLDQFSIDRYEVTNAQYERYLKDRGEPAPVYWRDATYPAEQGDHPVLGVSWRQANDYCGWAEKRLPTEAEWELTCRGGAGLTYPWGNTWDATLANIAVQRIPDLDTAWDQLANGVPAAEAFPEPVGSHPDGVSPYGALDLCGNASEWVADWYDPTAYTHLPVENPIGETPTWSHSVRGSAWLVTEASAGYLADTSRCGFRSASHSSDDPRIGFRCADTP